MDPAGQKVLVLWDQTSRETQTRLEAMVDQPFEGIRLFYPAGKKTADLLEGFLLPGLRTADRVFVIQPPDESIVAIAFEVGLAIGLGKPIVILESPSASAPDLEWSIDLLTGSRFPDTALLSEWFHLAPVPLADIGFVVPLPPPVPDGGPLFLCPQGEMGDDLRRIIEKHHPDWHGPEPYSHPDAAAALALSASRLLWVVPPGARFDPLGNILSALIAGIFVARHPDGPLDILRHQDAPMLDLLAPRCRTFATLAAAKDLLRRREVSVPLRVETLEIWDFKNIEHLKLDFRERPSSPGFPGDWTCIAGINGSGKTSILQALNLVLLGDPTQIGVARIARMLRETGVGRAPAEIRATVGDGNETYDLRLILDEEGVRRIPTEDDSRMQAAWDRLRSQLVVSYGASRNLSDSREDRHDGMSLQVRRQMTLFDPRTRVSQVEVLLDGGPSSAAPLRTLTQLLRLVLKEETDPSLRDDFLRFGQSDAQVEALDLPDGFRSTVSWLADLCANWHVVDPQEAASCDPTRMRGIVLLDEIDLHLHPVLQRELVPRLRKALPGVQFFVTTHSPLVLASFDRTELVVLDRNEEGGVRELDRQIFGFSADQIYQWLMETPPQSLVIEEKLAQGNDPDLPLYLLQSETLNEQQAQEELEERSRLIDEMLGD
jgi:energy-coupling factor transporter ATP-binding protein EcfA2